MPTIDVNGVARLIPDGTTIANLDGILGRSPGEVAVALNGDMVLRGQWATLVLQDGDRVVVHSATAAS